MAEFYELNKHEGRVIIPAQALAVAVATDGNIHFSFKTGLKQEIPTKDGTIEREVTEKFDIAISDNNKAQEILHSVLRANHKIADIYEITKDIDKTAQVRYSGYPVLKFKDNGAETTIPFTMIAGINKRSADSISLETQDGKSYTFLTDALQDKPKFKDMQDFMNAIGKRATDRLDLEIDLAEYGIIGIA